MTLETNSVTPETRTPLQVLEAGNTDDKVPETKVQPETKEVSEEKPDDEIEAKAENADELEDIEEDLDLSADEEKVDDLEDLEVLPGRIDFKEVKKTFPDLLKKFPALQANYFKAEQYTEILPTVESARVAAAKAEVFDVINEQALSGDISMILTGIEQEAPKSLNKIAETILPQLYAKDKNLYSAAVAPEIKKLVNTMISAGRKNKDENLENAALVLKHYVFGDGEMPADKIPEKEDPEKVALKNKNDQMLVQQMTSYENDTKDFTAKHLVKLIENDLDPEGKMSKFVREKTVDQILEDVNVMLAKNPTIAKEMNALWLKAAQSNFPAEMKPVIARAFLARTKTILPAIKQKRRNEVFGKNGNDVKAESVPKKTNIRQSSGNVKTNSPVVSKQEIRKENLSAMDVIMRGAS